MREILIIENNEIINNSFFNITDKTSNYNFMFVRLSNNNDYKYGLY